MLTAKALFLVGREKVKPEKGGKSNSANVNQMIEVVKRRIEFDQIEKVAVSPLQDDFVVIYVKNEYATMIETVLKTEFLTTLK